MADGGIRRRHYATVTSGTTGDGPRVADTMQRRSVLITHGGWTAPRNKSLARPRE